VEATVLVGRCVSYGQGATWLPLAEIVREAGAETAEDVLSLVRGEDDGELVARRIAGAIGADAEPSPVEETSWAVRRLFETLSVDRPLLVVFEDVHWAEPALLDLIEYLGNHASGRVLVLALTRPELLEQRVDWRERAITLRGLPAADMTSLVTSLQAELDPEGRRRVVEVAEGNPLFAEQLVARAHEEGPASLDSVPPSIEGLLSSRLDLLAPAERRVLQCAAIIGRQFAPGAVVAALAVSGGAVDEQLESLSERRLIRPARTGELLSFHHVLVRNAAYASVPKRVRAEVHERAGEWLKGSADGSDELVGYHLEQAYRYRAELGPPDPGALTLARRAAHRLASAGSRAADRDDWHAAANLLSRAAALLPPDHADRPPILARLGEALAAMGDFVESTRVLGEAAASARAIGDRGIEWRALIEQSLFARTTREEGWFARARGDADEAIRLFTELQDDRGLAIAWRFGSWIEQWNGHYAAAVASLERALEHARRAGDGAEATRILGTIGPNLVFGPEPVVSAADRLRRELSAAETDGGPRARQGVPLIESALRLYEQKGNLVLARRTRALLDELGATAVLV
jgi:tetratricopeptide (TPR) repeat protein